MHREARLAVLRKNIKYRGSTFSPDGSRVIYVARQRERSFLVDGDKESARYEEVNLPNFLSDGTCYYYTVRREGRWYLLMGADELDGGYESLRDVSASPDGRTFAYTFWENNRDYVRIAGTRCGNEFDGAWSPRFSPDGRTSAYVANKGLQFFIMKGDAPLRTFEQVLFPVFSPDGRVAYPARRGDRWFLEVEEEIVTPEYDAIEHPVFSANGRTMAYAAERAGIWFAVFKGREGSGYTLVTELALNPQGTRLAYRGASQAEHLVVDDVPGTPFELVLEPVWSPDGSRLAFIGDTPRERRLYVGGKKSDPLLEIRSHRFTTDGSGVEFGALQGKELWWKVMPVEA